MQSPTPRPQRDRSGRRVLLALSFGAIGLTLALVVLAGLGTFFIVNSGQAKVLNATSELPKELVLCSHFQPTRMVVIDLGRAGKHYRVEGECPVSALALRDSYVSDLAYAGWTVHADATGNIAGYRYSSREILTIVLGDSSSNPNQATVTIDMSTDQDPPSDFPSGAGPTPSAAATTAPRPVPSRARR